MIHVGYIVIGFLVIAVWGGLIKVAEDKQTSRYANVYKLPLIIISVWSLYVIGKATMLWIN